MSWRSTDSATGRTAGLSRGVLTAVAGCYLLGFAIVFAAVGPWEAVRRFAVDGLILALWLWVAHRLFRDLPNQPLAVRRPKIELALGLMVVAGLFLAAAAFYQGAVWARSLARVGGYLPALILLVLRYDRRAWGLAWGGRRVWLAALTLVVINLVVGPLFGAWLAPGELPDPPAADLASELTSPRAVLLALGGLLIGAALPEELTMRVFLQPRLARYLGAGWAMLAQALLFSALHFPQSVWRDGEPLAAALASVLVISNGLLAGYFWQRTRSLPVLLVLHLFAFPRIGL